MLKKNIYKHLVNWPAGRGSSEEPVHFLTQNNDNNNTCDYLNNIIISI